MTALVYIAGPYTHPDPVQNTRRATETGMRVHQATGAGVVVPHLSLLADAMFPRPYDWWLGWTLAQLASCTHLVRLPGESRGAAEEEAWATEHGIPVYHEVTGLIDALRAEGTGP